MRVLRSYLILALLFPTLAFAVIPPIDEDMREESATHIVTGFLTSIHSQRVLKGDLDETLYTASMIPFSTEKGELMMGSFKIHFRRIHLSYGMCGAIGQNDIPKPYTAITAYMFKDSNNRLHLMEPYGWEQMPDENNMNN